MIVGIFGIFDKPYDLKKKFSKNFTFTHEVGGQSVTGTITLNNSKKINTIPVLYGTLIDYQMKPVKTIIEDNDTPYIKTDYELEPISAEFQIIGNQYVRLKQSGIRSLVFPALTIALGANQDYVRPATFDVKKIDSEHPDQWAISLKRNGHWSGGTLYGENLRKDDVIGGDTYNEFNKNSVGFHTEFFSNEPLPIIVSKKGSVLSFANVPEDEFIEFFMTELKQYIRVGRPLRRRRTS